MPRYKASGALCRRRVCDLRLARSTQTFALRPQRKKLLVQLRGSAADRMPVHGGSPAAQSEVGVSNSIAARAAHAVTCLEGFAVTCSCRSRSEKLTLQARATSQQPPNARRTVDLNRLVVPSARLLRPASFPPSLSASQLRQRLGPVRPSAGARGGHARQSIPSCTRDRRPLWTPRLAQLAASSSSAPLWLSRAPDRPTRAAGARMLTALAGTTPSRRARQHRRVGRRVGDEPQLAPSTRSSPQQPLHVRPHYEGRQRYEELRPNHEHPVRVGRVAILIR